MLHQSGPTDALPKIDFTVPLSVDSKPLPSPGQPPFIYHDGPRLHQLHRRGLSIAPPRLPLTRLPAHKPQTICTLFSVLYATSFGPLRHTARSYVHMVLNRITISYHTYSSVTPTNQPGTCSSDSHIVQIEEQDSLANLD
jgi:hypothetical protein